MATTKEIGGEEFYSALQKKAMAAVSSVLKSPIYPIQYPGQGDFSWYYQNLSQVFNGGTYDYISARVYPSDDIKGTAKITPSGGFPSAYQQIVSGLSYDLSTANKEKLNKAQENANVQKQTVVSNYVTTFGQITQEMLDAKKQLTPIDYIIGYIFGSVWSGKGDTSPLTYTDMANARNLKSLLPKMPMSGDQVVTDVENYLEKMAPVNVLSNYRQNGSAILRSLYNNVTTPTIANGGSTTVNPSNGAISAVLPTYSISSSIAAIYNDLNNKDRTISLSMKTSAAEGGNLSVSVDGGAGFKIGSWLRFSASSTSVEYDMSKINGTSTDCSVAITWTGYTLVPISPLAWQQATNVGWYDMDPIAQAVKNGTRDVDGFRFEALCPYNMSAFKDGGDFGMLNNLLIANYPTVSVTYTNANFSSFKQSFAEKTTGNLTLFGFIRLGSFSKSTHESSYKMGADNSTFTVTFEPSKEVVNVPDMEKKAYVIGCAVENPGVD